MKSVSRCRFQADRALVCKNNTIPVGKAAQLWQPSWEGWISHLPVQGRGRKTLTGRNPRRVYVSVAGSSRFTHPHDKRAGWAWVPALGFLKVLAAWTAGGDHSGTAFLGPGRLGDQL